MSRTTEESIFYNEECFKNKTLCDLLYWGTSMQNTYEKHFKNSWSSSTGNPCKNSSKTFDDFKSVTHKMAPAILYTSLDWVYVYINLVILHVNAFNSVYKQVSLYPCIFKCNPVLIY